MLGITYFKLRESLFYVMDWCYWHRKRKIFCSMFHRFRDDILKTQGTICDEKNWYYKIYRRHRFLDREKYSVVMYLFVKGFQPWAGSKNWILNLGQSSKKII